MNIDEVKWAKAPSVVLVLGNEQFFKDQLIEEAQDVLSEFESSVLWGDIDSEGDIRSELRDQSFFSNEKLVVIRNADQASRELIEGYTENPDSNYVVVLVSKSKGRTAKWFKNLKYNKKVKYDSPKSYEYKDFVKEYTRKYGYSIEENLAEAVCMNVGENLYALSNELKKMFLFSDDRTITAEDIKAVLVQHEEISPFKITKQWGLRNTEQALKFLSVYLNQSSQRGAYLGVVALLQGHLDKMIRLLSYYSRDYQKSEICSKMGISYWIYDQLIGQVSRWRLPELRRHYRLLCDIEKRSKQGANGEQLLYWFISQVESDLEEIY